MKSSAFMLLAAVLALAVIGCGGKKDDEEVEPTYVAELGDCPADHIEVTPARVDDESIRVGEGSVDFTARAVDAAGNEVPADLVWSIRYHDFETPDVSARGHRIEKTGPNTARFTAGGIADGLFVALVEDRSCNMHTEDEPQYAYGQGLVTVYPPPDSDVYCGRMRVTYGDEVDRNGEEVIASSKVTYIAEVLSRERLDRKYRVRFFVNEEPYPSTRPLHKDPTIRLEKGMEVGQKAVLPSYLVPGDFRVRYELYRGDELVCGSRSENFSAR